MGFKVFSGIPCLSVRKDQIFCLVNSDMGAHKLQFRKTKPIHIEYH